MKKILILTVFLLSACATKKNYVSEPFIGKWNWHPIKGAACPEIHEYFPGGKLMVYSGEEIVEEKYVATNAGGGFYKIDTKNIKTNGKLDCFGNKSSLGSTNTTFIFFNNMGALTECWTADGMNCFGSALKVK